MISSEPPRERRELAEWCRRRLINHFHPDKPTGDHAIAQEINSASGNDDAIIALAVKYKFIKKSQAPKRQRAPQPSMLEAVREHAVSGKHDFSAGLAAATELAEHKAKQNRRRFNIIWNGLAFMEHEPLGIPPARLTKPRVAAVLKFAKAELAVYCEADDVANVRQRCEKLQRDITDRESLQFG